MPSRDAGGRLLDLALAFAIAGALFVAALVDAMRAGFSRNIIRRGAVGGVQWHPAGIALTIIGLLQAVAHCDSLIEQETIALPKTFSLGDMFEIFQYPALEMMDIVKALCLDISGRLFAADTAGAEHRDLRLLAVLLAQLLGEFVEPCGKVAEAFGVGVDRAVKAADRHFIAVAGVDHHRIGIGDQVVPSAGIDIIALGFGGIDAGNAHRHNFLLQPDFHPQKRHRAGFGIFDLQPGEQRQRLQIGNHRINLVGVPGNGAVNPFVGEQYRALEMAGLALRENIESQGRRIIDFGEMIKRGDFNGRCRFGHGSAYRAVGRKIPTRRLA